MSREDIVLNEVCEVVPVRTTSEPRPVLTFKGLSPDGLIQLSEPTHGQFATAKSGDIVFTKQGHAPGWVMKKVGLVTDPQLIHVAGTLQVLRPRPFMNPRYLYYWLLRPDTYNFVLRELGGRAGMTEEVLKKIPIRIVPMVEQIRVVSALDDALAAIRKAQANVKSNIDNCRRLFDSHLEATFVSLLKSSVERTLQELVESHIVGIGRSIREQGAGRAFPYVKMNNITEVNRFDASKLARVDATKDEVRKYSLRPGDLLFNTRNSFELVGKSCIFDLQGGDQYLFNNNVMRIRFNQDIEPRYILHAFSFTPIANALNNMKSGTTNVSAIYFKDLKNLGIPIPQLDEQKRCAEALDALAEDVSRAVGTYEAKLGSLSELKDVVLQSLLEKVPVAA